MSTQPMRDMGLWVAIGLTLVIIASALLGSSDEIALTQSSYGKIQSGFGAVYDLLHTLEPKVSRSRAAYAGVEPERTLWLMRPGFLELRNRVGPQWSTDRERNLADELRAFIERGGRAVVFGGESADWSGFGLVLGERSEYPQFFSESEIGPRRRLELQGLRRFASAADGEVLLSVGEEPVVVRIALGSGSLIAVSDARLFDNQHLDSADHSPLVLDLARAYGVPVFDERCHGFVDDASVFAAVGGGRLWLLGIGFGLWGLTVVYARRSVPAAELPARPEILPGLGSFVDPLALLYSRSAPRNAAAVYRAYVNGLRFRLRRSLFGPRGGSDALLDQRLAHELAHSDADLLAELRGQRAPRNAHEIEAGARRMERYLGTAVHARKHIGGRG